MTQPSSRAALQQNSQTQIKLRASQPTNQAAKQSASQLLETQNAVSQLAN
jgi:hypothetical protein